MLSKNKRLLNLGIKQPLILFSNQDFSCQFISDDVLRSLPDDCGDDELQGEDDGDGQAVLR